MLPNQPVHRLAARLTIGLIAHAGPKGFELDAGVTLERNTFGRIDRTERRGGKLVLDGGDAAEQLISRLPPRANRVRTKRIEVADGGLERRVQDRTGLAAAPQDGQSGQRSVDLRGE